MLQNNQVQALYREPETSFDPRHYFEIFKKRWLFFVVPAILVAAVGAAIVILRPATYISQGKILIESQQIPVELVRPTVTATAAARIQVIEQRVMTRDHLLAVARKFQVFADHPRWWGGGRLSSTEILDKMRARTQLKPIELDLRQSRQNALAFSISFEYERPDVAMRVANELLTLILAEDARTRTSRAVETTQFLAREQRRLEVELASLETQILEFRRKNPEAASDHVLSQLMTLRSDLEQKLAIYSPTHPSVRPLRQQIAALEKVATESAEIAANFDSLQRRRSAIQKNLDDVAQKLTVARRGETLERDQQSERLEIIEQAVMPTQPVKGNRLKLLVMVFGLAFAGGVGSVFAVEMLDRTVRGTSDLASMIDTRLIVGIPYIATKAEVARNRRRIILGAQLAVGLVVAALAGVHFLWTPLDELWDKILLRIMG
jgi:uncharacterized protein involved in exopolysaccharide biosynthesis